LVPEPSEKLIPLRTSAGDLRRYVTVAEALRNAGHWHLTHNRRGHLRCAIERTRASLQPLSNDGTAFEQELPSGRIWALKGTSGSGKPGTPDA